MDRSGVRLKDLLRTLERKREPPPPAPRALPTSPTVSSRLFDIKNTKEDECISLFKQFSTKLQGPSTTITQTVRAAPEFASVEQAWSPFTAWGYGHPAVPIIMLVSIEDEPKLARFLQHLERKLTEHLYETVVYTPARTHRDSIKGVVSFSTHATEVAELVTNPELKSSMTNFGFRNSRGVKPGIIWKIYVNADETLLQSVRNATLPTDPQKLKLFFARIHALWIANHYAELSALSVLEEAKKAHSLTIAGLRESFGLPENDAMGNPFTIDTIIGAVMSRKRRFNRATQRK